MNLPVPAQIEFLGGFGFDLVFLDAEHGSFEVRDIEACCRAAELCDLTIVARVPDADAGLISRFLNAGVQGIVVPHVETAADARRIGAACRYAPRGLRSSGGARSNGFWRQAGDLETALAGADANVTLSVQIESVAGLAALPAIIDTGAVDYFTIGKQDLAQSMGHARLPSGVPPEVMQAVRDAEVLIRARGGRMKDDLMRLCRVNQLLAEGARSFLAASEQNA